MRLGRPFSRTYINTLSKHCLIQKEASEDDRHTGGLLKTPVPIMLEVGFHRMTNLTGTKVTSSTTRILSESILLPRKPIEKVLLNNKQAVHRKS